MAEYRLEVEADASRAIRTINLLEKAISEVTKEFKEAEIGEKDFVEAGLEIGRLTKEVADAKGAIVNVDRAQRQFNQALEAGNKAFGTAIQAAQKYNDGLQKLANESYQEQQKIRDKNFQDEVDDWDRRLKVAVAASSKIAQQQRAVMEFRAGMGARGAISGTASPIEGTPQQFGSPAYFNALNKDLAQAIAEGRRIDAEIEQAASARQNAINQFRSGVGARGGASNVVSSVEGTPNQFGSPAYFEALNKSLAEAIAEGRRIDAEIERAAQSRQDAINQFRAGMAARGAIPAVASPIRGGAAFPGSPEYIDILRRNQAAAAAGAGGAQAGPSPQAFDPRSLAAFEGKLKTLKNEARLIAPNNERWKELTQEIIKTERQVRALQKAQTGGPSAQSRLGAAGGAFLYGGGLGGGAGSALGGVAGGLLGGVSGAFTGAALGQFADNIGNALAATAKFTAEIDKQRIALRNVIGDTEQYNQALEFINKTSKDLAIPQEILNQAFTQISASVIGAGGSARDAEEAFLGIAAGIRGTGGSLADMEGALRATAQVFSKGKVSAEELRQQIGERLPGAFTLFAESIGKKPQELDKMLEQGQVGLNDFMVFVRQLSSTYGASAQEIAASTQAAGDRMAVAMSTMREAVGRELQPVGAEFQAVFADFVQNQSPNFINAAKTLAEALKPLASALKAVADNAEAVGGGIAAFAAALAAANLPVAIAAITTAIKALTAAAIANPFVALAAGIGLITAAAIKGQMEINRYNDLISGSAGSQEDLQVAIAQTAAELKQAEANMDGNGRMAEFAASKVDTLRNRLLALEGRYKAVIEIEQIFTGQKGVPSGYKKIDGRLAYEVPGQGFVDAETGKVIKQQTSGFKPTAATGGGGGGGRKARGGKGRESRLPELTEELSLAKQIFSIDQQIAQAQLADNQLTVLRLNGDKEQLRIASEISKIKLQKDIPAAEQLKQIEILRLQSETKRLETNVALQQQIQQELKAVEQAMMNIATTAAAELEDRKSYERLVAEGLAPAMAQITVEVNRQFAIEVEKLKMLEKQIQGQIALLEAKQNQTAEDKEQLRILHERLKLTQQGITGAPALVGATIESRAQKQALENKPQTAMGFLTEASDNAQKELAKLTNWGFQAVEGAKSIGSAFGQAFKDIASGSMSAQEALASMMQSIADHFLDMAAQIIAQQITMMIYGLILKALGVMGGLGSMGSGGGFGSWSGPSGAGAGGFGTGSMTLPGLEGAGALSPAGMYSGIKFADGGIVTGPTLGLVGEGKYNEAIVPLPNGRSIPVQFQGETLRDKMNNSSVGGATTPILSMNFETTRFGDTDYVSRDQLELAMAETRRQAARDGAQRGMTMTLDRIQQSPQTRSRLGLR